jgi:thiol-disulfide isomerase/thioredoxin
MLKYIIDLIVKFILWLLSFLFMVMAAKSEFIISRDTANKVVITGKINWEDWQKNAEWQSYTADEYKVNNILKDSLISIFKKNNIKFILFGGSWCSDSKEQMPRFFKILKLCDYPIDKVELYGLDRKKEEQTGIAKALQILNVPTLIIIKNNNEVGRIIETPSHSWEEDIFSHLNH